MRPTRPPKPSKSSVVVAESRTVGTEASGSNAVIVLPQLTSAKRTPPDQVMSQAGHQPPQPLSQQASSQQSPHSVAGHAGSPAEWSWQKLRSYELSSTSASPSIIAVDFKRAEDVDAGRFRGGVVAAAGQSGVVEDHGAAAVAVVEAAVEAVRRLVVEVDLVEGVDAVVGVLRDERQWPR